MSDLSPDEVRKEILDSLAGQWEWFDAPETWVLTTNRDISMRLLDPHTHEERQIDQPDWANSLPNPASARNQMRVEYRGAPIDHFTVYQLDEYRLTVVGPSKDVDEEQGTFDLYLTNYEFKLSKIMSGDDLAGKIGMLDIEVR